MINASKSSANHRIDHIDITTDLLADRGGLAPLLRYVQRTGVLNAIAGPLEKYRTGGKGIAVSDLIGQVMAFLFDGTSRHLTHFDHLKTDPGYAALLETNTDGLASSHQVKRFFTKLPKVVASSFRRLLRCQFTARLEKKRPTSVALFLDTMVLDNDDAEKRQGCQPTYKKVKGFQPLQLIWEGQVIDAQFRGGKKHGNHGKTAFQMIAKAAKVIRKVLGYQVPILVRMDGGFYDGDLFWRLDATDIGFVCSGRLSDPIKEFASEQNEWEIFSNKRQEWSYFEFGTRCKNWERFYRAIYLKPRYEGDQLLLEFVRPEQVILTNMGSDPYLFAKVDPADCERLFAVENLITEHHRKGGDELTHRGLKDLGFEQLPFKRFGANMALYYLMVIAFNLMEEYKEGILVDLGIVGRGSYASTVRRVAVDFAAKIVRTSGQTIMKVTSATMERLRLDVLWRRCNEVVPLWA